MTHDAPNTRHGLPPQPGVVSRPRFAAHRLTTTSGGPAPAWFSLSSNSNLGSLAIGEKRTLDINFTPGTDVAEGLYEFRLTAQGSNLPATPIKIFASITQSGIGSILFKAADLYTATLDKSGHLIPGLAGARIVLQNEAVVSQQYELVTDALGEAYFQNLPAGRYQYRASAANHQEIAGRFQVKPGLTVNESLFLDYNLITVEWSVREVTIQDRYEITLKATYETDVPAPVVVFEPASMNLPAMQAGDIYYGQLNLTNYGLVRADNVRQVKPKADAFFRFEFLADIPPTLDAKQRITIPYRIIALQSLEQPAGSASGGGCYSYSNSTAATCESVCANGTKSTRCGSSSSWYSASNSSCGSGSSVGGGSWGGSGSGSGSGPSYTDLPGMPPCVNCGGPPPPCGTCGGK